MLKLAGALLFWAALLATPHVAVTSEPSTIGLALNQLYSEQQPTKRGAFIVRRVEQSSAAADAGIQPGDLILAIDGKRVFNTDAREVINAMRCPSLQTGHTPVLFLMSKEPRPSALWSQLDAIRDGFQYEQ